MRAARGAKNLRWLMLVPLHQSASRYRLARVGRALRIEARRNQILAVSLYYANEDIMTPNQASTKADQSAASSSNVIVTNQSRVACNGGGGPLGHPQVR
jgi:hypothetical protein